MNNIFMSFNGLDIKLAILQCYLTDDMKTRNTLKIMLIINLDQKQLEFK